MSGVVEETKLGSSIKQELNAGNFTNIFYGFYSTL